MHTGCHLHMLQLNLYAVSFSHQMSLEVHFKEKMNTMLGHLAVPGQSVTDDDIRSLMFGDYMGGRDDDKVYDEIKDLDQLREVSA